ncbi:Predicted heterodisulfide reductase/ glutamate synthase fusion protein HdrL [Desulfamplus magnetovallimortis]|uniref:Predicted heterodisulfide reductase/ glutamate synthase fusion protein HdrL n=1 Tax=Desulfamplus magnetovallimortis TaxID=1246637 RepID=A0A1W1H7P3_9BACT|nr:FAD-dependent oxidoreductase [Desulfamplus magnetovallimortis]SLM28456.1 Predicted heterodisulfide reductase/ glutamate synthase fusion protein HdrL [Desulfamplus magnetovallimortis]
MDQNRATKNITAGNCVKHKKVIGSVMVVGGGIAGIQASLDLADSGFLVHLVDRKPQIGGVMAQLDKTFPTNDCAMCVISPKLVEAGRHLNIDLHTMTEVDQISGEAGNFKVTLRKKARYVDLEKCTACGECAKVCPVDVPNMFDQGLRDRKAVFKLYPQGMPGGFAVDKRGTAPCKATCPAHVGIQGFIALMKQGKFREAIKLFKDEHPFPGVCGRVCHHPCESECTRCEVDDALAVQHLHRVLADMDFAQNDPYIPETGDKRDEKVAVAGSGPAGLTAAYFLAKDGYDVTVFEKLPVKGGMMAVGIPEYRLPQKELEKEIAVVEKMGVRILTHMALGKEITLHGLQQEGYAALFIATGLHGSRSLGVEGENLEGVLQGVHFLRETALGKIRSIKGRVVVIGGGNVAVDVALTARRLGSADVTMVCLEGRHEMPAWDYEVEEALEEKVKIENGLGPARFIEKNGAIFGVEFKRCTSVFDENGRFNPQYDPADLITIETDHVIVAIGQTGELEFAQTQSIPVTNHGGLAADPLTLQTSIPWVFAGGDAFYGPKSVVDAVACGKEAAESIHRFLRGTDLAAGRERQFLVEKPDTSGVPLKKRAKPVKLSVEQREGNFDEITFALNEDDIRQEADRCLSCGICSECFQCVEACIAGAIDHTMTHQSEIVEVGAVIIASGFSPFDPSPHAQYNYASHPNVLTSLEFERILSASGPCQGHLLRPSDGKEPGRIAWLQCVGSRDINTCDNGYCSSVCCMYAVKQSVIAKEHSEKELDTAIFYMDMRTFGKDFDRYYMRARDEYGVRFIRSRIHTVEEEKNGNLKLTYATDFGKPKTESFDMVVLSVGMIPDHDSLVLARKLGIELNRYRFVKSNDLSPVSTSRKGIYVCGAFQSPKDIPQSVMEASAAAAAASGEISSVRGTLIRKKELPPEINVSSQQPRIGVFVCNCGINIGGVADVPAIRDYAATLPHVVHVEDNLFTCSQDTQDKMKQVIVEHDINRVVVASCSPRTHEPLFQETIREAGLNKYLFEMANIRDQNTWVHMEDRLGATAKAIDLVRMAVAKASRVVPLHETLLGVTKALLVIGGGVAGMEAALGAANQGFQVYLVERERELGGVARHLHTTVQGEKIRPYLENLIHNIMEHKLVRLFMGSEAVGTTGILGNFETEIISVNEQAYTTKVKHGATILATGGDEYKPREYHYGAHPGILTHLDLENLFEQEEWLRHKKRKFGSIEEEFAGIDEACAETDEGCAETEETCVETDELFDNLGEKPAQIDTIITDAGTVVFIQCVGSRSKERDYCSRICCTNSIKKALKIKDNNPDTDIFILYRDIRTYGFREALYTEAREKGIIFIRYDEDNPPELTIVPDNDALAGDALDNKALDSDNLADDGDGNGNASPGKLKITVMEHILKQKILLEPDIVVLASAILPNENKELFELFRVPVNSDGFLVEAHAKLRPVDFASEGLFLAGLVHYPKSLDETIAQSTAALSRALVVLSKDVISVGGAVAEVADPQHCACCLVCVRSCPYEVPRVKEGHAFIEPARCHGCGVCAAECPAKVITLHHFTDPQIIGKATALFAESAA